MFLCRNKTMGNWWSRRSPQNTAPSPSQQTISRPNMATVYTLVNYQGDARTVGPNQSYPVWTTDVKSVRSSNYPITIYEGPNYTGLSSSVNNGGALPDFTEFKVQSIKTGVPGGTSNYLETSSSNTWLLLLLFILLILLIWLIFKETSQS